MKSVFLITMAKTFAVIFISLGFLVSTSLYAQDDVDVTLVEQVTNAEIAFAKTMADRDFEAFKALVSKEAIFFSPTSHTRGRDQIAELWKPFYQGEIAPFSWRPETVVVLESGNLALSTGPVFDPSGKLTSYYTSTWRQEEPGVWRVIFDKGNKACELNTP